jgi:multisubunit Na+/H+ antiporter MnhG subunit
MTHERGQLVAYIATLLALVVCFLGAIGLAALNDGVMSKIETFGLGTLVGGLIGVLRLPSPRTANATQDDTLKTAVDKIPPTTTGDAP